MNFVVNLKTRFLTTKNGTLQMKGSYELWDTTNLQDSRMNNYLV